MYSEGATSCVRRPSLTRFTSYLAASSAVCASARPAGAEYALDDGRALEAGNVVLQVFGVDGSVGGLRAVLESFDGHAQELLHEVAPRMDGEDFRYLILVEPVQAQADHVGLHSQLRGGDLRGHPAGNSRRGVQRDCGPYDVGGGVGESALEQELVGVVGPIDLEALRHIGGKGSQETSLVENGSQVK